jgi:hypothetical protein
MIQLTCNGSYSETVVQHLLIGKSDGGKSYEIPKGDGLLFSGDFHSSHVVTFVSGGCESSGI